MKNRILCPFHKESTPSCILYKDHYRCYGCGSYGPLTDLKGIKLPPLDELDIEPEDLSDAFSYIDALPLKTIRGLELPADDRSYFVVWPDKSYYKRRFFSPGDGPKYIGAKGHNRGLYWARKEGNSTLALVEGELNAASIAKACPDIDVASPGGVGDFMESRVRKYYTPLVLYSTILLIVDRDVPGAGAVMNALGFLKTKNHRVVWKLMSPDANEVLENLGSDALKQEIERAIRGDVESSTSNGSVPV